ncbi:MAG: response regulator transcription factor [Burkholderiales bacterium]|nr:response regulator transcription factor [Burkholderiales bacterium]
MHLLLVEDDLDLGQSLQQSLKGDGFTSEWVRTSSQAREFADAGRFDCVVLDLSLPDGSGLDLLRLWRGRDDATPVIIITARSALTDRLAGLDGGADDFVLKPFAPPELFSRIRAVMRRYSQRAENTWACGRIQIETRTHEVRQDGSPIELSPREFQILLELARRDGGVISKDELAERLAPLGDPIDFNAIEVHVHNLRRKLGAESIVTVRGVGYRMAS